MQTLQVVPTSYWEERDRGNNAFDLHSVAELQYFKGKSGCELREG